MQRQQCCVAGPLLGCGQDPDVRQRCRLVLLHLCLCGRSCLSWQTSMRPCYSDASVQVHCALYPCAQIPMHMCTQAPMHPTPCMLASLYPSAMSPCHTNTPLHPQCLQHPCTHTPTPRTLASLRPCALWSAPLSPAPKAPHYDTHITVSLCFVVLAPAPRYHARITVPLCFVALALWPRYHARITVPLCLKPVLAPGSRSRGPHP